MKRLITPDAIDSNPRQDRLFPQDNFGLRRSRCGVGAYVCPVEQARRSVPRCVGVGTLLGYMLASFCGGPASVEAAEDSVFPVPAGVVAAVSPTVFPYEAVRVELRWRNESHAMLRNLVGPPSMYVYPDSYRRPMDQKPIQIWQRYLPDGSGELAHLLVSRVESARTKIVALAPGEQIVWATPVAGHWAGDKLMNALFDQPGPTELRMHWVFNRSDDLASRIVVDKDPVVIKVMEAREGGPEFACVDVLRREPLLVEALHNIWRAPDPSLVPRLNELLDLAGATAYADYARFALARHHGGSIVALLERRVDREAALAALALLKAVETHKFVYGPEALRWERMVAFSLRDDEAQHQASALMDRLFPRDRTRICDFAGRTTDAGWRRDDPLQP